MPEPQDPATRPLLAVLVVILTVQDDALKVLLVHRDAPPEEGRWALPGGLLRQDEALDAAAVRKLENETGLADVYLEQLYTFGDLDGRAPSRAVAVAYFALVRHDRTRLRPEKDWEAAWFCLGDLPDLAFDNRRVVEYARERLRNKLEYTNVAYNLLPEQFTLSELQAVYESILGRPLDKRNFRKRMLSLAIIRPTERTRKVGAHRPARLYSFRERRPVIL